MEITRTKNQDTRYTFSDLDLAFKIHPVKKDLTVKTDLQAVFKSIRNLLLTNHYERPFHPEIGSNLARYLFEPITRPTMIYLEKEIYDTLVNFEPRIKVNSVDVYEDINSGSVIADIGFYLINSNEITKLQLPFGRFAP